MLLGGRRQERCLLSVLLLHPGQVVSTARLIDLLWPGEPPASAQGTIHTYVGRLRAALRPYGLRLETRHEGYLVDLTGSEHAVDVHEFTALTRLATATVDPAERVRLLDHALSLRRGPLLADVADDRLRDRLGGGLLAEQHLTACEQRAEAALTLGQHDRVATELVPLLTQHPTRERLVAAQMSALYRGGRQADALQLYRTTREILSTELGVEPGSTLRTLHERVLRADPRLDRPATSTYAVRVDGHWLPLTTSGHPALEFCNTYAGWGGRQLPGSEWLGDYDTLVTWAAYHDLVETPMANTLRSRASQQPQDAAHVLCEARDFRTLLYACLTTPGDAHAFKAVATVAQHAGQVSEFVRDEDGLGRWRLTSAAGLRLPLLAVSRSATELLAQPRHFTVCACQSPSCGWLFLDRGGRRRWCRHATCGDDHPGEEPTR